MDKIRSTTALAFILCVGLALPCGASAHRVSYSEALNASVDAAKAFCGSDTGLNSWSCMGGSWELMTADPDAVVIGTKRIKRSHTWRGTSEFKERKIWSMKDRYCEVRVVLTHRSWSATTPCYKRKRRSGTI